MSSDCQVLLFLFGGVIVGWVIGQVIAYVAITKEWI